MDRYWFISYHTQCYNGMNGIGQTFVQLGEGPFNVKNASQIVKDINKDKDVKSVVILNYFEVDEETFKDNCG